MNYTAWRSNDSFPANIDRIYRVRFANGKIVDDYGAMQREIKRWQPLSRVLMGNTESTVLLPPVCIPEFSEKTKNKYHSNIKATLLIFMLFFTFNTIFSFTTNNVGNTFNISLMVLSLATLIAIDEFFFLKTDVNICDRARYLVWLQNQSSFQYAIWVTVIFFALLAMIQMISLSYLGDMNFLLSSFGIIYKNLEAGQFWRLLSGPFIHSSMSHLFGNMFIAILFAPLAFFYLRWWSLVIFIFGCIFGSYGQWILSPIADGLTGVSAGVFALCGAVFAISLFDGTKFPRGFTVLVCGIGIVSIYAAYLLNPVSANIAHIFGYAFGFMVTMIFTHIFTQERN